MRILSVMILGALLTGCGGAFSAGDPLADAGSDGLSESGHPDAAGDATPDRGEAGADALATGDAGDGGEAGSAESGVDGQADSEASASESGTEAGAEAGCVQGTSQCIGVQLETCEGGTWVSSACPFVCTESGGTASCTGVCSPGATTCSGQQPEICNSAGTWHPNGAACPFVCTESGGTASCTGACAPGSMTCSGQQPEICSVAGTWQSNGSVCASGQSCSDGSCATITSCAPSGAGMTNCGPTSESCCTSLEVAGGTFERTYTNSGGGPTGVADPATVSTFRLDKYLVTVGRFRQFVNAWNGGYVPPATSGKHTHLNGGLGLSNSGSPGTYETGWVASNDGNVAPTNGNLACDASRATWTPSAGSQENLPINCLDWYESYAFCIWDDGFLPSEAEWEYAASGGSEELEYPWGSAAPGTSSQYAIYGCDYPSGSGTCTGVANIAPVGSATLGAGRWGQFDLAGEMWEWTMDWYATYTDPCTDCAALTTTTSSSVSIHGGPFLDQTTSLPPTFRGTAPPASRAFYTGGFRCARTP